ncbi:hypothetical protein GUJ93_ZPchr0011g28320 [Zizania palustris]|uniref:Uncharacterized protein n=1 Tax=Zizania palustris TaxID=103762 RepID=A0A8J5WMP6_ZIZPA|nr:hypothetical protein GUJ93_ZPchr0011g28320 [Zizania palustris]
MDFIIRADTPEVVIADLDVSADAIVIITPGGADMSKGLSTTIETDTEELDLPRLEEADLAMKQDRVRVKIATTEGALNSFLGQIKAQKRRLTDAIRLT